MSSREKKLRYYEDAIYTWGNRTHDLEGQMVSLDMQRAALQSRIDSARFIWKENQQLWEDMLNE